MSENNNENNGVKGGGDDLHKLMMAGLGAVVHLKEKGAKWIDEMAQKGQEPAQELQPTIEEWARKGRETLEQGKAFGADAMGKLQKAVDGLKDEAKQMGLDELLSSLGGLTDEALSTLRDKIDEIIAGRKPKDGEE